MSFQNVYHPALRLDRKVAFLFLFHPSQYFTLVTFLLQDLKRTQATSDALATLMSSFFGGSEEDMPFRHVHLTEYPLGGSSRRVRLSRLLNYLIYLNVSYEKIRTGFFARNSLYECERLFCLQFWKQRKSEEVQL